jgi:SAM-dependent methyltransferase
LPDSIPIDPVLNDYNAYDLPLDEVGYIFSSHCLEHLHNWVEALDYWHKVLNVGGVVFLYLPDHSQSYWRPWNNRKHIHCLTPEIVGNYFLDQPEMWKNVFVSGIDLNNSFTVIAEKI